MQDLTTKKILFLALIITLSASFQISMIPYTGSGVTPELKDQVLDIIKNTVNKDQYWQA